MQDGSAVGFPHPVRRVSTWFQCSMEAGLAMAIPCGLLLRAAA
jgi:hypothetical protein